MDSTNDRESLRVIELPAVRASSDLLLDNHCRSLSNFPASPPKLIYADSSNLWTINNQLSYSWAHMTKQVASALGAASIDNGVDRQEVNRL